MNLQAILRSLSCHVVKSVIILLVVSFITVTTKESDKNGISSKAFGDEDKLSKDISPQNQHSATLRIPPSRSYWQSQPKSELEYCDHDQPDINCSELNGDCLDCDFDNKCRYGSNVTITCRAKTGVVCKDTAPFKKEVVCQYCYQTPIWQQICEGVHSCNSVAASAHYATPRLMHEVNCTVSPDIVCLGHRRFKRMVHCNWKNGYRWSTTFILSITLGGFGADRFYLGRWQEGIGKLFSFGGLGIWTIVDIILIGVRYLGAADGSLYVD